MIEYSGSNCSDHGPKSTPLGIFVSISLILLAFTIIFLNSLSITAIVKSRRLRSQPTSIFLGSLSLADLCVSTGVLCILGEIEDHVQHRHPICLTCALLQVGFVGASYMSLMLVAVDRYIAINHSLRYASILTPMRCIILIIISWIFVTTWTWSWIFIYLEKTGLVVEECTGPLAILPPTLNLATMFGMLLVVCSFNAFLYARICCVARKQQKSVEQQRSFKTTTDPEVVYVYKIRNNEYSTATTSKFDPPELIMRSNTMNVFNVHSLPATTRRTFSLPNCKVYSIQDNMENPNPIIKSEDRHQNDYRYMISESKIKSVAAVSLNIISAISLDEIIIDVSEGGQRSNCRRETIRRNSAKKELKLIWNMVLVMVTNLLLALPYFIASVVTDADDTDEWVLPVRKMTSLLVMSNSAVNPLIHTWGHKKYRRAVLRLFGKGKHRRNNEGFYSFTGD